MICRYCGEEMRYGGVTDGGGDYADELCDQYYCDNCDWSEVRDCLEAADELFPPLGQSFGDGRDYEDFYPTEDDANYLGDIPF